MFGDPISPRAFLTASRAMGCVCSRRSWLSPTPSQRQYLYDQLAARQVAEDHEILYCFGNDKAWSEFTKEEVDALIAQQDRHLEEENLQRPEQTVVYKIYIAVK